MNDLLKIVINGEEKFLRPSFSALRKIEATLDIKLNAIITKLSYGDTDLDLIAETIFQGLQAAGNGASKDDIEKAIDEYINNGDGLMKINELVSNFFLVIQAGPEKALQAINEAKKKAQ